LAGDDKIIAGKSNRYNVAAGRPSKARFRSYVAWTPYLLVQTMIAQGISLSPHERSNTDDPLPSYDADRWRIDRNI